MTKVNISIGSTLADHLSVTGEVEDGFLKSAEIKASGCLAFLRKVGEIRNNLSASIIAWDTDSDCEHVAFLLRELQLRLLGQWGFPYKHDELCHCRVVATEKVDRAILNGAKTAGEVAQMTSAGTGCGTCVKDTEEIIRFRCSKS